MTTPEHLPEHIPGHVPGRSQQAGRFGHLGRLGRLAHRVHQAHERRKAALARFDRNMGIYIMAADIRREMTADMEAELAELRATHASEPLKLAAAAHELEGRHLAQMRRVAEAADGHVVSDPTS